MRRKSSAAVPEFESFPPSLRLARRIPPPGVRAEQVCYDGASAGAAAPDDILRKPSFAHARVVIVEDFLSAEEVRAGRREG